MTETSYHQSAINFVKKNLLSWSEANEENTCLTLLTGNSNKVFLVQTTLDVYPNQIIYRIFGPNEITNKDRERRIFSKLSHEGLGPKNLGDSTTERLEQYFEGYEPLNYNLFTNKSIIKKICKKLKKMHSLDMSEVLLDEPLMTDENPKKWRDIIISKQDYFDSLPERSFVLELISQSSLDMYNDVLPRSSKIVYSHLDPSPINFLYNESNEKILFIDYEFSGFSFRSMDMALMLNEMQLDFLYDKPPYYKLHPEYAPSDELIKEYVIAYGEGKDMWVEVKRTLIATHYLWAMWSLAMYNGPTEGYNYLTYSMLRFNEFKNHYNEYMQQGGEATLRKTSEELFS